ncbi:MAG: heparan-alpha-glucosaminide N-acetyltransferase domain-containing protein [Acidobacteria bacterium]|nr:heparan-alpha-glucosaminide N-acetyltransferase domain-containing protein [Acidobacteriota bacterium]
MKAETAIPLPPVTDDAATATRTQRVNAVDLLRGIVMVLMLLDHTRDFFHREVLNFDASDLTRTNTLLFFTRWVTHFCAPVFVFLAGTGAFLQLARGRSKPELSRFLITRGLWLILLELTVIRVIVWFNIDYHFAFMLQVIWVIGLSMILLAGLIYLPLRFVAIGSIVMIALHNLLDSIRVQSFPVPGKPLPGGWDAVWMILHQQGLVFLTPNVYGFVLYPLIPLVGVLAAGYCFGAVYQWEAERRRRVLFRLGASLLLGFVVLRSLNIYGDPSRWSVQKNWWFTVLSFLNVTKYPTSLLFLLMTLGAAILALPRFEQMGQGFLSRVMITFGRVPLFFYLGQWLTAHGLAVLVGYLAGQPIAWQFVGLLNQPRPNPGNLGFSLWVVYVSWLVGLILLYPLCRWFAEVKRRRRDWWLSYL